MSSTIIRAQHHSPSSVDSPPSLIGLGAGLGRGLSWVVVGNGSVVLYRGAGWVGRLGGAVDDLCSRGRCARIELALPSHDYTVTMCAIALSARRIDDQSLCVCVCVRVCLLGRSATVVRFAFGNSTAARRLLHR